MSAQPVEPSRPTVTYQQLSEYAQEFASNPGNDHISKLRDYPRMGVPVYIIIDPRDGTVTVHSDPDTSAGEPRYADARSYKFGDLVQVGIWSIDTGTFPRYRSR